MTEANVYAPPQADLGAGQRNDGGNGASEPFYVVSPRKFVWLFLATLGGYSVYWFYRNWRLYKLATGASVMPIPRGLFAIFFTHALTREVDDHARARNVALDWDPSSVATRIVLLSIVSSVLDRLSWRGVGSPVTDLLSIAVLAPLVLATLPAQRAINAACGDPGGDSNSRFSAANVCWLVIGVVLWLFVVAGWLLPGE